MAVSSGRSRIRQDVDSPPAQSESWNGAGPSMLDELLTSRQVASILQMKVSTVEDYARRGVLPSVKLGRHRRFIRSQLDQAVGALAEAQGLRLRPQPLRASRLS
jgi:excisionase family DNA binding protein